MVPGKLSLLRVRQIPAVAVMVLTAMFFGLATQNRVCGLEVRFEMWDDPDTRMPEQPTFLSSKSLPVWLQALAGPEDDLKRQAANTIVIAHQRGMGGLEAAVEPLTEVLRAEPQHPITALAAAEALCVIDARQADELLFQHAQSDGMDMAQIVEPTLARWDYPPIRPVWLERISTPRVPRRLLMLAIHGLGTVRETKARPRLLELAQPGTAAVDIRLAAAEALGQAESVGLLEVAQTLAADKSPGAVVDRLVAVSMISGHRDEPAVALMLELAVDPEPAVAAIALGSLTAIDPELIFPLAPKTTVCADANVRRITAEALVARPTVAAVRLLGPMLDDHHPAVRRYVRQSLEELASRPELADPVIEAAMKMLATERWRGLEQASLLLVRLDHKPAAGRLVELLEFPRPEVFITAAWGLGRMSLPETIDAMFDKAKKEVQKQIEGRSMSYDVSEQICHLWQALGRLKVMRCDPLLRHYIPKDAPFAGVHRAGAIWALGHLHAGQPQADLAKQLCQRLADDDGMFPEDEDVRLFSAIAVGRMKSKPSIPYLKKYYHDPQMVTDSIEYACGWALEQITGEPVAKKIIFQPVDIDGGWFLEPLD